MLIAGRIVYSAEPTVITLTVIVWSAVASEARHRFG